MRVCVTDLNKRINRIGKNDFYQCIIGKYIIAHWGRYMLKYDGLGCMESSNIIMEDELRNAN